MKAIRDAGMRSPKRPVLVFILACAIIPVISCGEKKVASRHEAALQHSSSEIHAELERRRTGKPPNPNSDLSPIPTNTLVDDANYQDKALYLKDTTFQDSWEFTDGVASSQANSVAALVDFNRLQSAGAEYRLAAISLGQTLKLCGRESFVSQPVGAFCTGFVVSKSQIATAEHCLDPQKTGVLTQDIRFVFNFVMERWDSATKKFPKADVFKIAGPVDTAAGYALITVEGEIKEHPPLDLEETRGVNAGEKVYALGYPSGVPLKYTGNATVSLGPNDNAIFKANLNTFKGNSGSPVFNARTHKVEGILQGGEDDYGYDKIGKCNAALVCSNEGCGETCSRIAPLVAKISPSLVSSLPTARQPKPSEHDIPPAPSPPGSTPAEITGTVGLTEKSLGEPSPKQVSPERLPFNRIYSSQPKESGIGSAFSPWYELPAETAPPGYKIGYVRSSLTGDRNCGAWAECQLERKGTTDVTLKFRMQGHSEWVPPGSATSTAQLVVTYVPL